MDPNIPCTKCHIAFALFRSYQRISPGPRDMYPFHTKASFYGEELLASRPNSKLEDHPLSAARDCLFYLFAGTLHTGSRLSIHNLKTRRAVVTGTHLSWTIIYLHILY
jgi:hypothetical protein